MTTNSPNREETTVPAKNWLRRMGVKSVILIGLLGLGIGAQMLWERRPCRKIQAGPWTLEVAETAFQIRKGLMGRKQLGEWEGMVFLLGPEHQPATFWMKDCLIPLDMVFVGEDCQVQGIFHAQVPQPSEPMQFYILASKDEPEQRTGKNLVTRFVIEVPQNKGSVFEKNGLQSLKRALSSPIS